jgi:zinc/manganese transport system substrate-binding protein
MKAFRKHAGLVLAAALLSALSASAAAKLNVVASVPCLGDMAREIGGDRVKVDVLASGREDFHAVPARPSFLPRLNRADLLLNLGLDAEHAWLPALAAEARNPRIREGGPGWIETYPGIRILDVPTRLDRSEGEQHPRGNPHYNVGPHNGRFMARNVAAAFTRADADGEAYYTARLAAYLARIDALEARLREAGAPLRGVKILSHHPDVSYLAAFYGMESLGSLEPKPGVAPTASHLRDLSERGKAEGVRLVLYNQAQNDRLARRVAGEMGAGAVQFLNMVGSTPKASTWMELQEENLNRLLAGFRAGGVK